MTRRHCAKLPRPPLPPFEADPADPESQRWLCEWRSRPPREQWLIHDFLTALEDWWTGHPQATRPEVLQFIHHWAHAHDWDELAVHFDQLNQKMQKRES